MNVLTVGAYERDNFGDLLFFIVLKEYMKEYNVVPSSVTYSDMTATLGEVVLPYDSLLQTFKWDAVWVVGGEVGGADIDRAVQMSFDESDSRIYNESTGESRDYIKKIWALPRNGYAYIPTLKRYEANRHTPLFINSVGGLASMKKIAEGDSYFEDTLDHIKEKGVVSVRDKSSFDGLKQWGVTARLSPDMVHVLPKLFTNKKNKSEKYIVFQVSEVISKGVGCQYIADLVMEIATKYNMNVKLLSAGVAPRHDDPNLYDNMKLYISDRYPDKKIDIIETRDPLDIAMEIANANLWVGSSLHGRIISASYAVPRVSLKKDKIDNYAKQWDPVQPFAVELADIAAAADEALSASHKSLVDTSKTLIKGAEENLLDLKDVLQGLREHENDSISTRHLYASTIGRSRSLASDYYDIYRKLESTNDELGKSLRSTLDDLATKTKELDDVLSSRAYKLSRKMANLVGSLRNIISEKDK